MGIPMLKIRRPVGRLIFNMGIAIPSKTVFLIETASSEVWSYMNTWNNLNNYIHNLYVDPDHHYCLAQLA